MTRLNENEVGTTAATAACCSWSSDDTQRFKGLAILLIVLHNFFHLVLPLPKENEFGFSQEYANAFRQMVFDSPIDFIRCTSSFLGHFGVQAFIFLSAYGLTKKFMSRPQPYGMFIVSRYRKIYPVFIAAIALWLLKIAVFSGPQAAANSMLSKDLLLSFLGISNLFRDQALAPVGPWWFIAFIFQFYWIYPLLYRFAQRYRGAGLFAAAAVAVVLSVFVNAPLVKASGINLYFTFIGHLPELCLGIYLAMRQKPLPHAGLCAAVATVVFALGLYNENWWHLNHISALVLLIALDGGLKRFAPCVLNRLLVFYGTISLPLFLVNAYLRHPFIDAAQKEPHSPMMLVYALAFLLTATGVALGIHLAFYFYAKRTHKGRA